LRFLGDDRKRKIKVANALPDFSRSCPDNQSVNSQAQGRRSRNLHKEDYECSIDFADCPAEDCVLAA
jgi:hypothetical protein